MSFQNNNNNSRRQTSNGQQQRGTVQVYTPGFKSVLNIPTADVHHFPPQHLNVTRLVLCANYDGVHHYGCQMGDRCKFVHADTRRVHEHTIHVNYAWRSMDLVTYERYAGGGTFHVAAPNGKVTTDVISSQLVLKTRALESNRRPLSHCAHYYYNRTCNLGADCQFIHAVFVDPTAADFQRAPVPSQLGRQVQRGQAPAAPAQQQQQQQQQVQTPPQTARKAVSVASSPSFVTERAHSSTSSNSGYAIAEEHEHASASSNSLTSSPVAAAPKACQQQEGEAPARCLRFRHNPYAMTNSATVCC